MPDGWEPDESPLGYSPVLDRLYVCNRCGCVVPLNKTNLHSGTHTFRAGP